MVTFYVPRRGFVGSSGTVRTIGVLQWNGDRRRKEHDRRDGANVEATNVLIATHVEPVEGRGHVSA